MRPEMPFLAAGAISLGGGVAVHKGFPPNGVRSAIGTVVLVLIASATADTAAAPLVHAIGLLFLLAAVISATRAINNAKKGK